MKVDLKDLNGRLDRMNRARLGLAAGDPAAEHDIERAYRASGKLAIYGTLAPGQVNHHHIAELGGEWHDAAVRGTLGRVEHGIHRGLPGMRLDAAAPLHPVKLLLSDALADAWERLDAFEGPEMQRLLVRLESPGGTPAIANIYALRRAMISALG